MDGDNLGPTAPWQIKEFPVELRRRLTAAAAERQISVGEHLTRIIMNANGHATSPAGPSFADLRDLGNAVAAMATASGLPVPKRAARRFYGLVDDQVRAAAGLPARKPRQPPPRIGTDSPTRIESRVPDSASAG